MRYLNERNRKKTAFLCYAVFSLLLAACGASGGYAGEKGGAGSEAKDVSSGAMGRYMESSAALPEEIGRNGGLNFMADGSLTIVSFSGGLYRSRDEGASWQKEETDWFPMIEDVYCLDAVMGADGTAAATCSGKMPEEARAACGEEIAGDWEGNYLVIAPPGEPVQVVDFGFSQDDASCINSLCFKEDGRLFAGDMGGKVYEISLRDLSLKELFAVSGEIGCMDFAGEILMAVTGGGLYLYDLSEQVLLSPDKSVDEFLQKELESGSVAYTGGGYPLVVFGGEDGIVYVACQDGVYRHALGGSVMEQIIDGALSSFGDAGSVIYQMKELPGEEYLALFEPSVGLARYTFDETVPSMPEQEIRIYSLAENRSIRQAATVYKKEHPEMYVRYETGMEEGSALTAEEAVKKLNTEILAGEGPDVLILDDLPIEEYQEKGLLQDISGILESCEGELFENLAESFREMDGSVYQMPLCFRVPLFVGEKSAAERMRDLQSFAAGMEDLRKKEPDGGILGIYDAESLLRLFGMVSSGAWTDEAGELDRAAVEDFLYQMKRIYDAESAGDIEEEKAALEKEDEELESYGENPVSAKLEVCSNVLNIPRGYARLACGYVDGIQLCLDSVTSVIDIEEGLTYQNFNGQQQNVFLPEGLIGISAGSNDQEAAKAFVRELFSEKAQEALYEGFPINRAAFEKAFAFYEPGAENGVMTLSAKDGTEKELALYWVDGQEKKFFTELVERLETPAGSDTWLTELVYGTGVKVLEGEISTQEGADEIVKRAAIYLRE